MGKFCGMNVYFNKAFQNASDGIRNLKEVRIVQSNPANLLLGEFSSNLPCKYP